MTQPNIPVMMYGGFSNGTWNSSQGYAGVIMNQATGTTPPAFGSGTPCNYIAICSRTSPTDAPIWQQVLTSNTDVPSELTQYLTPDYLMFVVSAAFCSAMPQGDLYTMLSVHGGSSKLNQMEAYATKFACGINSGMVYMLATIPGTGIIGSEFLEIRASSSTSDNSTYVNKTGVFSMLLELVPSPSGQYSPVELS